LESNENILLEQKALDILSIYSGANNYLLKLKHQQDNNKKYYPTRAQAEYIVNYSETIPKVAKKWVDLDPYFAQKLAEEKLYTQIPSQIWIEKLLVEREKSYHVWGKFWDSENIHDFWLPKAAIIKTHKTSKVEIDYSKYSKRAPLQHQKEAIEKLVGTKKFILADDMGLGKTTATVIAMLEINPKKVLILCPASLKINWLREIQNYSDKSVFICDGKNFSYEHEIIIMNYDILKNFHTTDKKLKKESPILNSNFDLVIMDEAHYISNPQAQRTKLVNDFVKTIDKIWLLSGTPMTSRPINYYNLLHLIDSPVAQNWMAYVIRYCKGYQFRVGKRKIWKTDGAGNLEELRDRTSGQFLRRLKTDVLDLPDKIITPIFLRLNSKSYEDLMGEYYDWFEKEDKTKSTLTVQFSKLMSVRQVIAEEKLENTIELAENILAQGKKIIIFTCFTNTLNKLVEKFGKECVYLDGSSTTNQRQKAVDDFQNNDKIRVFVGNLKAAGVGLTLTAAEAVIMNDLSFVPADHEQAEDRAFRYGQKNNVSVFYPIFENTIENIIYNILSKKKQIIGVVMGDNENVDQTYVVEEILKSIQEKRDF
jgi:SWI/SNF-related matrix-associated actin-dependent regulator of chromatin subfamily A-like protein 1